MAPPLHLIFALMASASLSLLPQRALAWSDALCRQSYGSDYVVCSPRVYTRDPRCPCGQAYWTKSDNGDHCCRTSWLNTCREINQNLYPHYYDCGDNPQCQWADWTYEACSTACGTGQQSRTRRCPTRSGGNGETQTQSVVCTAGALSSWGAWSGDASTCSTTCGSGGYTLTRTCLGCVAGACTPSQTSSIAALCYVGNPAAWTAWSNWGACSSSCGSGYQISSRTCAGTCAVAGGCQPNAYEEQRRECNVGSPGTWAAWGYFGPCSTSCGTGTQSQSRFCSGTCAGSCSPGEQSTNTITCTTGTPATWGPWTSFGACSNDCGTGSQTRTRTCEGTCSGSCGAPGTVDSNTQPCITGRPYSWAAWSSFEPCNNTCGTGIQSRTRRCEGTCDSVDSTCVPNAIDSQSQPCTSGIPTAWTEWVQGGCEQCGLGTQSRTRVCQGTCTGTCPLGQSDKQSEPCAGAASSSWTAWTSWGVFCSSDCGPGNVTRSRRCQGQCEGFCSPIGETQTDYKTCNSIFPSLADPWQPWTSCNGLCGNGTRARYRQCSKGCSTSECPISSGRLVESQPCLQASWSPWTPFSSCNATCGAGLSVRNRTCQGICQTSASPCTLGATDTGSQQCFAGLPAQWASWTAVSCTNGSRLWQRQCLPHCYGSCSGNNTTWQVCDWYQISAWAGPLFASATQPLTMELAQSFVAFVTSSFQNISGSAYGDVTLRDVEDRSEASSLGRREASHVNASLSVSAGRQAGSWWLAVQFLVFPQEDSWARPRIFSSLVDANQVAPGLGEAVRFAQNPPVLPADGGDGTDGGDNHRPPESKPSGSGAAVPIAVVLALLAVIFVLLGALVYKRRQAQQKARITGAAKPAAHADTGFMMNNPAYNVCAPGQLATEADLASSNTLTDYGEAPGNASAHMLSKYDSLDGTSVAALASQKYDSLQRGSLSHYDNLQQSTEFQLAEGIAAGNPNRYSHLSTTTDRWALKPEPAWSAPNVDIKTDGDYISVADESSESGPPSKVPSTRIRANNHYGADVGVSRAPAGATYSSLHDPNLSPALPPPRLAVNNNYGVPATSHAGPPNYSILNSSGLQSSTPNQQLASNSAAAAPVALPGTGYATLDSQVQVLATEVGARRYSALSSGDGFRQAEGSGRHRKDRNGAIGATGSVHRLSDAQLLCQLAMTCSLNISSSSAQHLLAQDGHDGAFIVRQSSTQTGLVISFWSQQKGVFHERLEISEVGAGQWRLELCGQNFGSLVDLLRSGLGVGRSNVILSHLCGPLAGRLQHFVDEAGFDWSGLVPGAVTAAVEELQRAHGLPTLSYVPLPQSFDDFACMALGDAAASTV